jgi:hypothetical protein
MISRRTLFGLIPAAAAAVGAPPTNEIRAETYFRELEAAIDFGTQPSIMLCGIKHTDMNRQQLIEWVEHLDWHIGNLNKRIEQIAKIYGGWMLDVPLSEDLE